MSAFDMYMLHVAKEQPPSGTGPDGTCGLLYWPLFQQVLEQVIEKMEN